MLLLGGCAAAQIQPATAINFTRQIRFIGSHHYASCTSVNILPATSSPSVQARILHPWCVLAKLAHPHRRDRCRSIFKIGARVSAIAIHLKCCTSYKIGLGFWRTLVGIVRTVCAHSCPSVAPLSIDMDANARLGLPKITVTSLAARELSETLKRAGYK